MFVKRSVLEGAAIAIALGIVAVLGSLLFHSHDFAIDSGQPVFGDFVAFWSAGRAALDGHAAEVHQRAAMFAYQKLAIPELRFYAPWNSPPTFLLIAAMLALAPFPVSALLFLAATVWLYLFAAHKLLPDRRGLIFAATAPAAIYHLGTVQVGLLIAGVSGLALYWLDRRPRLAGALVGLLAIKPHLAILWPLLFALSGRWRAFASAAVSTSAFVALGAFVFGWNAYVLFFDNLKASADLIAEQRITTPSYASLYANMLQLHDSQALAIAVQTLSAILAFSLAAWAFRRGDWRTQGAALCAATLLISPYLFFYDSLLLGVGAALLGAPRDRVECAAFVFAWGAGLSLPIGYFLTPLPICPLAAWLLLVAALRRTEIAAPVAAPALRT
jgi:Glycosyltransferase family 87